MYLSYRYSYVFQQRAWCMTTGLMMQGLVIQVMMKKMGKEE